MNDPAPVVVIGAARSGTNLLRDLICSIDGFDTWPCDEINYIWRHGNRGAPTDELHPEQAGPEVISFIRRAFDKQQRRQGDGVVVEKTCANSLRVPFVETVVPEARFVYITRDGRDVVASAMQRWQAELDIGYVARKARFVPPGDIPYYAARYFSHRLHLLRSGEKRLGSWGPRFEGMAELAQTVTLAELCAHQWRRCVELSDAAFERMAPAKVHRLRYEDLVTEPEGEVGRLAEFLDAPVPGDTPAVRPDSVGRWRSALSADEQQLVDAIIAEPGPRGTDDVR